MPAKRGRNESIRKAGGGPCEPGGLDPGEEDILRVKPVSLPGYPGGQALKQARCYLRQRETPQISPKWSPPGIPCRIASEALESALKRPQREELARVETYLYQKYAARLPWKAFRLNERTASNLIEARLFAGQWLEIKEARNYRKNTEDGPALRKLSPVYRKLSPVYMLSPDYLAEIAREDMKRGRLSRITASKPPGHRKPKPPGGIDLKTALWLSQGGISWNPLPLLSMLAVPLDYYPAEEAGNGWCSMLRGWRLLASSTASRGLCPSWKIAPYGGLHASGPPLQSLPGIVREYALNVDGSPLAELDFKACQLNISNQLREVGIMPDPLADILAYLRAQNIEISRQQLKASIYPIFNGRKRLEFIQRAQWDMGLTEAEAVELWEALRPLKTGSGRQLLEVQAEIMRRALVDLAMIEARPVLPLFDAIATTDVETVECAMKEASRSVLGEALPMELKTARQRSLFTG